MNKFDLQKLRDLPIEGVAQQLGLKVIRHKTLCPFHNDRTPSLSFHIRKNTFKCFVCDAHGSTIDLAMQVLGKDFKETCQWLANEHNVIITTCHPYSPHCHPELVSGSANTFNVQKYSKYFEHPFLNQAARAFLFEERKLDARVIHWCKLTSWTDRYGTSWLQIPYFDINGQLIGVQNRRLTVHPAHPHCHPEHPYCHPKHPYCHPELVSGSENTQQQMLKQVQHDKGQGHHDKGQVQHDKRQGQHDGQPRFRFPKGSSCKVYNLPVLNLLKEGEELWIAEGCSDCWALLSSGKKAIAIPSATLLKPKDLETLKKHHSALNLHMAPDKDAPGEKLFQELKKILPSLTHHSLPEGYKDFAEWYMLNC